MDFTHTLSGALLDANDKVAILRQALEALDYLNSFRLIHRDFRTTNLMWHGRGDAGMLKVIDLGLMLLADEGHVYNDNRVVMCNWKETKHKPFDWAPEEVKLNGSHSCANFSMP